MTEPPENASNLEPTQPSRAAMRWAILLLAVFVIALFVPAAMLAHLIARLVELGWRIS